MPPLSLSLAVFLPIIAILLLTRSSNNYELTSPNLSFSSPQTQDFLSSQESGSQDSLSSPYYASWRTWFYPHRTGYVTRSRKGGWNVLYHLGGIGPWVEMDRGKEESGIEVPETCTVDQVHMMSRHAERYPTTSVGRRHLTLLDRIQEDAGVVFNGSLAFLNNWTYFTSDPKKDFDQLTATGPYAGTLDAFTTGVRYRTRYGHLLPRNDRTRFWASDSARVIETAQLFASGLFGLDWLKKGDAELEVIPETFERGADTLTPGDTCLNYLEDAEHGHDHGLTVLSRFQDLYTPGISERLVSKEGNEAVGNFTSLEVYAMQEMCGFEIMTRGSSPWCDAFTEGDWDSFEYSRDLVHYYRAGPGNPYAGAMGWLFLNATAALLQSGPKAGTMFFSFVHDGDIAPFLTALDIFNDSRHDPHLPIEHIPADRAWRTSSILPMGARVTLERMTCSQAAAGLNSQLDSDADAHQVFVRVNVNDGIVQLPYCNSGPGGSCPLDEFVDFVQRRRAVVGDFGHVCGLRGDAGYLSFLRQH